MQSFRSDWGRAGAVVALSTLTLAIAACGGGGGGGSSTSSAKAAAPGAPTISAEPATEAQVGNPYTLAPAAQDPDGDTLAFSIENRPSWAQFNTATGVLSGTPTEADVGVSADIVITVSDGTSSASLPPFSITVVAASANAPMEGTHSVELAWEIPTSTEDGSNLNDLAGYRIHYGRRADALTEAVEITSPGINLYRVENLAAGTYYFAVSAVSSTGVESELSNVISREVG
jgi:hypothetical protein